MNDISVNPQTNKEYSNISSNQCSWCAAEFIKHKKNLRYLFLSNKAEFIELYNTCLKKGSEMRKEYNHRQYGENIDNKILLEKYDFNIISYYTIIEKYDKNFVEILPEDLKIEFYSNKYISIDTDYFKTQISDGTSYLASRHGLSFCIIPIINNYLILDPHVTIARIMTGTELSNYLFNENYGHTHITLIKVC